MLYEFGACILDTQKRLLTRDGRPVPLAPKTFELLLLLVESGGRALTKAELMQSLWPDTFVEEANLSFQISTLRKALGEDGPSWIETVPKHGYRFAEALAPVQNKSLPVPELRSRRLVLASALVIAAGAVALVLVFARGPDRERMALHTATPLTAYPGSQAEPSLSPDGSRVAFSWNGPNADNYDIYLKLVGPGEYVRLTTAPERDADPSWSADGRQIAFLRFRSRQHASVVVIPALGGGIERKVADLELSLVRQQTSLSWSADSKQIAVSGRFHDDEPFGIWLVRLDGGPPRRLTTGGLESPFDAAPAFSPDRKKLAFIRAISPTRIQLYIQQLTGGLDPSGIPVPLTDGSVPVHSIAWLDDRRIVFSAGNMVGQRGLRIVDIDSGRTVEAAGFVEGAATVSAAPNGTLIYARHAEEVNLWRFSVSSAHQRPLRLAASTFESWTPAYSHDGKKIAFASTRSGLEEIWVADADGSHPVQLTRMGSGHTANPHWSLDDRTILFNSWTPRSSLYLADVSEGGVKRVTNEPADDVEPEWSRDGKWIYFGSNKTGRLELYRTPSGGGEVTQITRHGGLHGAESIDAKWIYYSKNAEKPSSIWKVPHDGGDETLVTDGLSYSTNFAAAETGIYFIAAEHGFDGPAAIEFYDFAISKRKVLAPLDKPFTWGLALSPDRQSLVHGLVDHVSSNLMLVDNMR